MPGVLLTVRRCLVGLDLIRALLAGAAGAVLPGYFWAAVLRPTSGLGERLAYSTVVSMASVPTIAVILARAAHTGVVLWVALASVLIVFGSGLLVCRLRGPAPGSAVPVLRMPQPTRDPRVLGLVAAAIALGLLMMAAKRPPVLVLAVVAIALVVGGAWMAWQPPAEPVDLPRSRQRPRSPRRRRPRSPRGRLPRSPDRRRRPPRRRSRLHPDSRRQGPHRPGRHPRTRSPGPPATDLVRTRGRSACRCPWCATAAWP